MTDIKMDDEDLDEIKFDIEKYHCFEDDCMANATMFFRDKVYCEKHGTSYAGFQGWIDRYTEGLKLEVTNDD